MAAAIICEFFEREFGSLYVEQKGRPGLPMRLLVGLHYLKHLNDVSDERVVGGLSQEPVLASELRRGLELRQSYRG